MIRGPLAVTLIPSKHSGGARRRQGQCHSGPLPCVVADARVPTSPDSFLTELPVPAQFPVDLPRPDLSFLMALEEDLSSVPGSEGDTKEGQCMGGAEEEEEGEEVDITTVDDDGACSTYSISPLQLQLHASPLDTHSADAAAETPVSPFGSRGGYVEGPDISGWPRGSPRGKWPPVPVAICYTVVYKHGVASYSRADGKIARDPTYMKLINAPMGARNVHALQSVFLSSAPAKSTFTLNELPRQAVEAFVVCRPVGFSPSPQDRAYLGVTEEGTTRASVFRLCHANAPRVIYRRAMRKFVVSDNTQASPYHAVSCVWVTGEQRKTLVRFVERARLLYTTWITSYKQKHGKKLSDATQVRDPAWLSTVRYPDFVVAIEDERACAWSPEKPNWKTSALALYRFTPGSFKEETLPRLQRVSFWLDEEL